MSGVPVLDPDSESGRQVARDLGELIADVEERLAREAAASAYADGRYDATEPPRRKKSEK